MKTLEDRFEESKRKAISQSAISRIENITWCAEYAEPGYTDPGENKFIVFSDWNSIRFTDPSGEKREDHTMQILSDLLEKDGHIIEWEDEWVTCSGCNKAIRTSPTSYDWTMYGYIDAEHGEVICGECVEDDPEEYIEWLKGDVNKCNTLLSEDDLKDQRYVKLWDGYETGFHEGMNDDPKKVAKRPEELGVGDYIFSMSESSQFYITWEVFVPEDTFDGRYDRKEWYEIFLADKIVTALEHKFNLPKVEAN